MNIENIDLSLFFKETKKSFKIILLFLISGIILSLMIHYLWPATYKAQTVLQIGSFPNDSQNNLIENPNQLAEKIKYLFLKKYPFIIVNYNQESNLVFIENKGTTSEETLNQLKDVVNYVMDEHNQITKIRKEKIETLIVNLQNRQANLIRLNQQIAPIELEIFIWQNKLSNFIPSNIIVEPVVFEKEKISLPVKLVLGLFLGLLAGFSAIIIILLMKKTDKF